ncbi:MAG: DNA repair exonuclease, partial [Clostridia bacterium]|nr:DNA repair exonuclease [Clostridia bacterium]
MIILSNKLIIGGCFGQMIKILHCADFHIGAADSSLGKIAEKRRLETLLSFERVIDKAKERNIPLIAIAGDLFHSNNCDSYLTKSVFAKIQSVPDIKIIFSAGNHDPLDAISPFKNRSLPENLYVLPETDSVITFDDLKLRVYGRSFSSVSMMGEERFSIAVPEDDYLNLMVLHGDLRSDLKSDYNAITPDFIKNCRMDYIALGHIHKKTELLKLGDTFFAYCGCPEGQGFDELDEKGVYIAEFEKGNCSLEFIPISYRVHAYEKIDISSCITPNDITAEILSSLKEKYQSDY